MDCLDANLAVDFVDGRVDDEQRDAIDTHVAGCETCRMTVAALAGTPSFAGADVRLERLDEGARIDRYVIEDFIGRGGMGIVYRAYDPSLDRHVAVKQLHLEVEGSVPVEEARARLLREAKALAQLSHPNVVAIHDVGTFGEDVYLAMELVEGQTLRRWLAAETRSLEQILAVLRAAGEGLHAAHAAGLVHRDFKPDNVIVGDDGRARVLDFGLARVAGENQDNEPVAESADLELTRTGVVVGTPAYMAPEQHHGKRADQRADQFSFCVTAYQAVYGERPFKGKDVGQLAKAIAGGNIAATPASSQVPERIRQVLIKGLAAEPADRYESMRALVDALRPVTRTTPVWPYLAAALFVAAIVGTFLLRTGKQPERNVCGATQRHLVGVWDDPAKAEVKRRLAGDPAEFTRLSKQLEQYATRWTAMRTAACRDTQVHGSQTERILELRNRCLDTRLDALRGLTDHLRSDAAAKTVQRSFAAALELPPINTCADIASLERSAGTPLEPRLRAAVDALSTRMAKARRLLDLGDLVGGARLADDNARDARKLAHPPTLASALYMVGRMRSGAGKYALATTVLKEAVQVGAAARADMVVAQTWVHLIFVHTQAGKFEYALELKDIVNAAIARAGADTRLQTLAARHFGDAYSWHLEEQAAIKAHRRAVALAKKLPNKRELAVCMVHLADSLAEADETNEAMQLVDRALIIQRGLFGDKHVLTAWAEVIRGRVFLAQGKREQARGQLVGAIDIMKTSMADHPATSWARRYLGHALAEMNKPKLALAQHRLALAEAERGYGADDYRVALHAEDLASRLWKQNQRAEAIALYERSLAIKRRINGNDSAIVGRVLNGLCMGNYAIGAHDKAIEHCSAAIPILQTKRIMPLVGIAKGVLAMVLWDAKRDRKRALSLAQEAHVLLTAAGNKEALTKLNAKFPRLARPK